MFTCGSGVSYDEVYTCGLETCVQPTTSGSYTFIPIETGCFIISIMDENNYEIAVSSYFNVVTDSNTWVTTDKTDYLVGETVSVTFKMSYKGPDDSIAIYSCTNTNIVIDWQYTNNLYSGTISFSLGAGCYIAYLVDENDYEVAASSSFNVVTDSNTWINTDKSSYTVDDYIVVTFKTSFPSSDDWIGIFPCGNSDEIINWEVTNGLSTGSISFELPIGCYVASLLDVYDDEVAVSSEFNVGASTTFVTTDKTNYSVGETVVVSFQYPNPQQGDWIGIYDCSDDNFTWDYTDGNSPSTLSFPGIPAGCYYAYLFNVNDETIDWSYNFYLS